MEDDISKEVIEERCERCCYCQYIDPVDGFCYKHSKDCWKVEECEDFETV